MSPSILSRAKQLFTGANSKPETQSNPPISTQKQVKNLDSDAGFLGVSHENVGSAKPAIVNQVEPVSAEPPAPGNPPLN